MSISQELSRIIKPMAEKAGFENVEKYHELVFNKIFSELLTRDKNPLLVIPETSIWEAYNLAYRTGLNPLHGYIYAATYHGRLSVDLTFRGYTAALINDPNYLKHRMVFSDNKVVVSGGHSVTEWAQLIITFKDGREIECLPEFVLENEILTSIPWKKTPSRMNAIKALTRGVAFALTLNCGEADYYLDDSYLGENPDHSEGESALIVDVESSQVEVKADKVETLQQEVVLTYQEQWEQWLISLLGENSQEEINQAVSSFYEFVEKAGKKVNFINDEQVSKSKKFVLSALTKNAKSKQAEQAPVMQKDAIKENVKVEVIEAEDVTEAQLAEEAKAKALEVELVEEVQVELTEEVEETESLENQYDFGLIPASTRAAIDVIAQSADESGDTSSLLDLLEVVSSNEEKAYIQMLSDRIAA
ncbi:hypothetical protein HC723_16425 [Vibrio sp. S11_S32]|uniref:hypothetical protein n=1 Tax=Vibrio sp. S11_S32 TaxID=2720225 RepID=UPI001680BD71|nr:hypothetical protein [Vibrio sp. S11_S32]MBD1577976.1 hypothetical protein [Vibrio sp. S11_S32]